MAKNTTYVANKKLHLTRKPIEGKFVSEGDERFFKVENYDAMPPFLMTIVSDSDHWMFISSTGGLTAGRKNSDHAIFPYYTDDKIHESSEITGSKTILRVFRDDRHQLWEPFSNYYKGLYHSSRNLYKSITGNKLIFEEINQDLELTFRVVWMSSDQFGWIRQTSIYNQSENVQKISILDGIQNILPYGIMKTVQEQFSTLMDAYKKSELIDKVNLGIFTLSSIPVDRAEPSEALNANTVWSTATDIKEVLLSSVQLDRFRATGNLSSETENKGTRGAYLIYRELILKPHASDTHLVIVEAGQDSTDVHNLIKYINSGKNNEKEILSTVEKGTRNLRDMVCKADGVQVCHDERVTARHFSNVLFNIMRGGIYDQEYHIPKADLNGHIKKINIHLYQKHTKWIAGLQEDLTYSGLLKEAEARNDPDLYRIVLEYLPLTFSRRHGDPSRPWNRFSINVKNPDGTRSLSYEGNWRDIFQNWEALSYSYPLFLEGIIAKFLNASTADGYNPYRITKEGIDWETFDPDDPWSFIGYWGDHQIIYLLKLLELQEKFTPGKLNRSMHEPRYAFANVPYRIKPYADIIRDPNNTIAFDSELHNKLLKRAGEMGADGKLLMNEKNELVYASLLDKLLITLLTKLSNFIPGAGIWLNTQRPEWNDANNALVGNGVSMVTLYYLRRYINFLLKLLSADQEKHFRLCSGTSVLLEKINLVLASYSDSLDSPMNDAMRRRITDKLGRAGADYRSDIYKKQGFNTVSADRESVLSFLTIALQYIDHTIRENRRDDKLYHAYNLIEIKNNAITVSRLPVMLEGQVALMSSGFPDANEVEELLKTLKASELYRNDQQSYMLYPDKQLPRFTEKNNIPVDYEKRFTILKELKKSRGNELISTDHAGIMHFNGDFKNAGVLKKKIQTLREEGKINVNNREEKQLLDLYEELFNHHSFTGRSGSFYKYEGLGSIYWHMVSKLLLAVAENIQRFIHEGLAIENTDRLIALYKEIREGIGVHKNPAAYGAIPTDPYSHTPSMLGAQQPGMTGQVKEDIISRWFELGLEIRDGKILIHHEIISSSHLKMQDELSFTFCGTPFRLRKGESSGITLLLANGAKISSSVLQIETGYSREIFARTGKVKMVNVVFTA
ncbi:MAG: hypothetical protein WD577_09665 [Bacteroidales bacterium]